MFYTVCYTKRGMFFFFNLGTTQLGQFFRGAGCTCLPKKSLRTAHISFKCCIASTVLALFKLCCKPQQHHCSIVLKCPSKRSEWQFSVCAGIIHTVLRYTISFFWAEALLLSWRCQHHILDCILLIWKNGLGFFSVNILSLNLIKMNSINFTGLSKHFSYFWMRKQVSVV